MMRHELVVSLSGLLVGAMSLAASGRQPPVDLTALTAPKDSLPLGCERTPAPSERTADGRLRQGFWAGLPIQVNPWSGDDVRVLFQIRVQMFGPERFPDAPPDRRAAAQLANTLVEGMWGYAAFYRQEEALIAVYALGPDPDWRPPAANETGRSGTWRNVWLRFGRMPVLIAGEAGRCFDAVERHVRAAAEQ
jgi:hypothetical protein